MTGRLNTIRIIAAAYADDLRKRPTRDERHARGVLIALETAILHGSLESLITAIAPWLREEVSRVDALLNGPAHACPEPTGGNKISAAVGEMGPRGLPADEDLDDAQALTLPDAYTGIGG